MRLQLILFLTFITIITACDQQPTVMSTSTGLMPQRSYDENQLALGKQVFTDHCAKCHGENAQGANNWHQRNPDGSSSDRLLPGMESTAAQVNVAIVDAWMKRADLERTMQHFRILEFAKTAVEYDGGARPETLLRLGLLQVATGQYADATTTLESVLAVDPTNETAQQQLEALTDRQLAPPPGATP